MGQYVSIRMLDINNVTIVLIIKIVIIFIKMIIKMIMVIIVFMMESDGSDRVE